MSALRKAVKVHCGSAYVKGEARKYAYFIASLFTEYRTVDGRTIWRKTKVVVGPRRSKKMVEELARAAAVEECATFVPGYGSLHNVEIPGAVLESVAS